MIKTKLPSIWAAFVAFVFVSIFFSTTLLILIIYIMVNLGIIDGMAKRPAMSIFITLALCIMIASSVSYMIGKKVFKPINAISKAMTNVAKGDFNVRLRYCGDVRELDEISSNFNAMVHELGNIEALRNDFVVMISHEFKTPLAAIEGYATILRNPELTEEESREFLQKLTESIKQLANLSSSILMISNLENKEMITEKKQFRLDEQIRQAVLLLEPLWESKNVTFNIDLDHAHYFSNEELMMQVWINLISNAVKFTPKNGDISIILKQNKQDIEITVSDTGIGMTQDVLNHIFDKFYKADRFGYTGRQRPGPFPCKTDR
ncbi:MAG TPA: HAMP domain-containing sensor histidine kinase [Syntrophomonas sp.]|nr:HAMP domain-containing sensor histidine kinase [Syntrophomonas sp.]